jgi:hypothetical protein
MATDQQQSTPEAFINDIEAGVRKEFVGQVEDMRRQVREARDKAEAERICGQKATAEMTRAWPSTGAAAGMTSAPSWPAP